MVLPNFSKSFGYGEGYFSIPKTLKSSLEFCKLGAYSSWYITFQIGLYGFVQSADIIDITMYATLGLFFVYFGYLIYRGNRPLSILIVAIMIYLVYMELITGGRFSLIKLLFPIFSVYGVIGTFIFHKLKLKK